MNNRLQWLLSTLCGLVASFWNAYGALLGFMIGAIVFDVITGLIKAAKAGNLNSKKGADGFFKKMIFLVTFFFGIFLDAFIPYLLTFVSIELPFNLPFALIITCYIVINECISICENIYEINNQALPGWIIKILQSGKKKIDDMGDNNKEE